jgi:tetratricopeptide (TPR) repeat protein
VALRKSILGEEPSESLFFAFPELGLTGRRLLAERYATGRSDVKLNAFRLRTWLLAATWVALGVANAAAAELPLRLVASDPNNPSMFDSIGAGFKRGIDSVTSVFKPKPKEPPQANDSISLSTKARGGPELHVAMARLYEESDRKADAAKEYELALKSGGKDPQILAACAQHKARIGEFDEAIKLYERAIRLAPDDPALLNDMALCFARRQRLPEAISYLTRAIQLQPSNALYRNNIAAVLVEIGQTDEALRHLQAAHPAAVAHYNLGYLLHKKGQSVAAAQQFAYALQRDPSLEAAKYWLNRIGAQGGGGLASTPFIGEQPANAPVAQTILSPAPVVGVPPASRAVAMPPANTAPESAPLPPSTSPAPAYGYGYGVPPAQPAPVVGRLPSYDAEVRRQGFVQVIPPSSAKRLPPPDEPAPLPDDRVQRLPRTESGQAEPVRRLPPPVVPELD